VNGIWTGQVTLLEPATNALLRANDRQGHIAVGNLFAALPAPDEDADGLPDDWEERFFGAGGATPLGDPDHDGLSNLQEWLAGTDPTVDRVSRLLAVTVRGRDLAVRFQSVPGTVYRLERTANLTQPNWVTASPDLVGDGSILEAKDVEAASAGSWFYRLRLLR
jgi:hypothetical protein